MRGNTPPIRTGGINDPVAQSIRNEQMADAMPSPEEQVAMNAKHEQLVERLAELADDDVYLKDRDAVTDAADDRDWDDVSTKANRADAQEWRFLIKEALTYNDNQ